MNIPSAGSVTEKTTSEKNRTDLLSCKISDLSLQIPGSRLQTFVDELYRELDSANISFKPRTYLSDEWGCPHGVPIIGIPFYLASAELCKLEGDFTGVEAESEDEVMMLLRHEAGHALNYAYRFYNKVEWRRLFGQFTQPYREVYRAKPFSARYVRNVPGWYVQKHPDEDFAETFAVWLTPGSQWQERYSGTPAMEKLLYVDHLLQKYGRKPPIVTAQYLDRPVQELNMTLKEYYQSCQRFNGTSMDLPGIINIDLQRLFPSKEGEPAVDYLKTKEQLIIKQVNHWTGLDRHLLRSLFNGLMKKIEQLDLKIPSGDRDSPLAGITAFITTLAMNYQLNGEFIEL